MTETIERPVAAKLGDIPICADHDEECVDVKCKVTCWLYAPEEGICPLLNKENPND